MSEATDRRAFKLLAMRDYVERACDAFNHDDEYGYREAIEHLMGVVGSEVEVYGGVVPIYKVQGRTSNTTGETTLQGRTGI